MNIAVILHGNLRKHDPPSFFSGTATRRSIYWQGGHQHASSVKRGGLAYVCSHQTGKDVCYQRASGVRYLLGMPRDISQTPETSSVITFWELV